MYFFLFLLAISLLPTFISETIYAYTRHIKILYLYTRLRNGYECSKATRNRTSFQLSLISPQNFRPLITPIFHLMIFIKLLNTELFHVLSPRKKSVEVIQNYPEKTD